MSVVTDLQRIQKVKPPLEPMRFTNLLHVNLISVYSVVQSDGNELIGWSISSSVSSKIKLGM